MPNISQVLSNCGFYIYVQAMWSLYKCPKLDKGLIYIKCKIAVIVVVISITGCTDTFVFLKRTND